MCMQVCLNIIHDNKITNSNKEFVGDQREGYQ